MAADIVPAAPSSEWNEEEMKLEREHLKKIVNAFLFYKSYANQRMDKMKKNYHMIPDRHKEMVPYYLNHVDRCSQAVDVNYKLIEAIVKNAVGFLQNSNVSEFDLCAASNQIHKAAHFDMEKVEVTIKQFYRDWSNEGMKERECCYGPIINELTSHYPSSQCDVSSVRVLVPGAGLGRLAYDIAHLGYTCEGNEFSMFMLLASNFILNRSGGINSFKVHPWVLKTCNNYSNEDQLAPVTIPDVDPADLPYYGYFSMSAGDFLSVYTEKDKWDCVACSFFIDTAHNVIEYLEKIYNILKPDGIWINLGPLLYHFSDMPGEPSLELCWDDVKMAARRIGFEILKEVKNCPSTYIQNPSSMVQLNYQSVLLVAKKPKRTTNKQ